MVSETTGAPDRRRTVDEAIVEAARDSIMTVGLRRTSIAEIARQAGVSRPTVYRRYADLDELSNEVITREFLRILEDLRDMPGTARERIVQRFRVILERLSGGDFFFNLAETDPERIVRALVRPRGGSEREIIEQFIKPGILHGQEDGSVRICDAAVLSHNVFMVMQSAVLMCSNMLREEGDVESSVDEVTEMVDRYLRP
ncbi:TetR/AcrR family transcriptional regulator [uncultured Corynebacterium sp.]|uniref:TetR/AcrR family transcriptional regulator n=1 Tax=uncultured Corynebacterium sp. TaxID=159447 RepID=UPI0025D153A7|nr:TetR/AcrR family transcriptional regulator [uncultured Corynebacterium sp.]